MTAKRFPTLRAFTLVEICIVLVCVGILAALAAPQYHKSKAKTVEKQAAGNLNIINAFLATYKGTNGTYPSNMNNLSDINSTLGLSLMSETNMNYSCTFGPGPTAYECAAVSSDGWKLHVQYPDPGTTAHCDSGPNTCPSCNWVCAWG